MAILLAVLAVVVASAEITAGHDAGASPKGVLSHDKAHAHNPLGWLDRMRVSGHRVTMSGWTFDPDSPRNPIRYGVHVDGRRVAAARTRVNRPAVERRYHRTVVRPGFVVTVQVPYGRHTVCLYGYNAGRGALTRLTCRTITLVDPHNPRGYVHFTTNTKARTVTVTGGVIDPDARRTSTRFEQSATKHPFYRGVARLSASAYRASGHHGYSRTLHFGYGRVRVCVAAVNAGPGSANPMLGCTQVTFAKTRPMDRGRRIAALAKTYVGKVRYAGGGSTPRSGFDCSGLTRYVYRTQHISLAHSADAQYRRFHKIARSSARPGDLVFFLSGSHAYHVAVYEGRNMIVAAATYGQGVKYQAIWSSAVRFGTVLH